jgi:hypothetical protein
MELTVEQIIKLTIGAVVIVVVVLGFVFFGASIMDFFKNIPTGKFFLRLR